MKTTAHHHTIALSAQLVELGNTAPTEIRLVPAGEFRSSRDNRPVDVPSWRMIQEAAQAIIAFQASLKSDFLLDYDHQTLKADKNGQPAPAAGWVKGFEWRNDGLYGVGIDWTQDARLAIEQKKYRYISPVIRYDSTGLVTGVLMGALTNYPAIDDLTDLAAAAALIFLNENPKEDAMKNLLTKLGLAADADEAAALSAIDALQKTAIQAKEQVTALQGQMQTQAPDLSKYVPIEMFTELRDQVVALSGNTQQMQVQQIVEQGVKDGKILGDKQKQWATDLGNTNLAALQGFLVSAQPIAALSGMQTEHKKPPADNSTGLKPEEKAKEEFSRSEALQAEFGNEATYLAYCSANAQGFVKVLGDKK